MECDQCRSSFNPEKESPWWKVFGVGSGGGFLNLCSVSCLMEYARDQFYRIEAYEPRMAALEAAIWQFTVVQPAIEHRLDGLEAMESLLERLEARVKHLEDHVETWGGYKDPWTGMADTGGGRGPYTSGADK